MPFKFPVTIVAIRDYLNNSLARLSADTLGWLAAGGVDVVVAGDPAEPRGIDPAADLEIPFGRARDRGVAAFHQGLGAELEFNGEPARGQPDDLAVGAVDLGMEREIGREPLRLGRVDPAAFVADQVRRSFSQIRSKRPCDFAEAATCSAVWYALRSSERRV